MLLVSVALSDTFGPVASLPGISLSTKTLAGKVTTNATFGSELFMLFFESSKNPETDAVSVV